MTESIEKQVGAALARLLVASGLEAGALAGRLGLAPRDVQRLVAGDDPLDLARLQRVLAVLGQSPSHFFADLYAAPATASVAALPALERPLDREEIERLVVDLRTGIRALLRMMEEGAARLERTDQGEFTP
jgi:transcriptional regulator with XRE-family HTH domain